jgi:TolB-like protein
MRRLAAIVAADIAGYSRLMHSDEEATHNRLTTLVADAVMPAIAEHGGRIVKTTGDGFLAEFPSAVEALRASMQFQGRALELTMDDAPDKRLMFRVGINISDVIVEAHDIFGDGVNVAARLEGLAKPGGILVSGAAYEQVRGRLKCGFEDIGEQQLKNISHPVRAFRVAPAPAVPPRSELALPDRPSVAVLPFQNMSGDPDQEYFADGIVEDITTAMSHVKSLFVIARNSSFTYKGRSVDVKQVGRELGVRYVLEGSVRKAGNRVRITAQLVDTTTDAHIWADHFDGLLDDIFALQDEVTARVVGALEPSLRGAEIKRAQRKSTGNLQAYDLMLRALAHLRSYDRVAMEEGVRLLRKAVATDLNYAMALAVLAHTIHLMNSQGWLARPDPEIDEGVRLARLAIRLGEDDPEVLATSALTIALPGGDQIGGRALADKALLLNRNSAHALSVNAILLAFAGEIDASIASAERFARLSPFDNVISLRSFSRTLAHFVAGHYEATLDSTEDTLRDEPRHGASLRYRAASFGLLNRLEEGQEVVRQLLSTRPDFTVSRARAHFEVDLKNPFKKPGVAETLYEGLRRVGVPE